MWIVLSKCARLVYTELPFFFFCVNSSLTVKSALNFHYFFSPAPTKCLLLHPSSSVSSGDCTSSCLVPFSKSLMENMDNLWVWQILILMLICSKQFWWWEDNCCVKYEGAEPDTLSSIFYLAHQFSFTLVIPVGQGWQSMVQKLWRQC